MSDDIPPERIQIAVLALRQLSDEERFEVFGLWCRYCGTDNPDCQCWNDV